MKLLAPLYQRGELNRLVVDEVRRWHPLLCLLSFRPIALGALHFCA